MLGIPLTLIAAQASAHTGEGINTGFASGFWHPTLGWDHVAAIATVGMWGAVLGAPAIWILPFAFLLIMPVIVGLFAVFHGHAHGAELPETFSAYGVAIGFVAGTGLLHLAGIGIGYLTKTPAGTMAVRAAGGRCHSGPRVVSCLGRLSVMRLSNRHLWAVLPAPYIVGFVLAFMIAFLFSSVA